MSSCTVSGFFDITPRRRGLQGLRVADPLARPNLFGHYRSSIPGTMQSLGPVHIRPPTAAWNDTLAERAVVYVRGSFFAQTGGRPSLIDAVHMDIVLTSQTRHRFTVAFPPSHVDAVGTIAGEQYYYSPTFLALPVTVFHDVWDGMRTFGLVYVSLIEVLLRCVLMKPTAVSSRMTTWRQSTRGCHASVRLYSFGGTFRASSLPASSPWKWTILTTPFRSVPCHLKLLTRPIDRPMKN
jgi:hypothetical protein